jgi:superfamily II DNA helicase RecQ
MGQVSTIKVERHIICTHFDDIALPIRMNVQDLYQQVRLKYNFNFDLKPEQGDAIKCILRKKHVFAILPTGFGKSLCFVLPPLMLDVMHPETQHISIIISPLKSLMRDQTQRLKALGVKTACLEKDMDPETKKGKL